MESKKYRNMKSGAALLIVLFVVMAVMVISLNFLSRSAVELACSKNIVSRIRSNYLAESALEHARGIILNPQGVSTEYWYGTGSLQQLVAGSDGFYDVNIVKTGHCDYTIESRAYIIKNSEVKSTSRMQAELRLDPAIAYWTNNNTLITPGMIINGDVYCSGDLTNAGVIDGDAFAGGTITGGNISGRQNKLVSNPPVESPQVSYDDFSSHYYIGTEQYSVTYIDANNSDINDVTLEPTTNNPAGVYYYSGDLNISGNVIVKGTLVVTQDLRLATNANITIISAKNFPALIVGRDIWFENSGTKLVVRGYAQVGRRIDMKNMPGSSIDIVGALFIFGEGIRNTVGCNVIITGSPDKAAFQIYDSSSGSQRWSPAGGAFFKSIKQLAFQ